MIRAVRLTSLCLIGLPAALLAGTPAHTQPPAAAAAPIGWSLAGHVRDRLAQFATADAAKRPAEGGHVFVGSSIFEFWPDVTADMAPLPAFNRAIAGSTTVEQLAHIDALALQYRPRTIIFYAGSNDINAGRSAQDIAANVARYAAQVHQTLPKAHFLFVSINRAPQKRAAWAVVDEANALIRTQAAKSGGWMRYVDVDAALQDAQGEPLPGLYGPDGLHFLPTAYARFTGAIRPVIAELAR